MVHSIFVSSFKLCFSPPSIFLKSLAPFIWGIHAWTANLTYFLVTFQPCFLSETRPRSLGIKSKLAFWLCQTCLICPTARGVCTVAYRSSFTNKRALDSISLGCPLGIGITMLLHRAGNVCLLAPSGAINTSGCNRLSVLCYGAGSRIACSFFSRYVCQCIALLVTW